MRIQLRCSFNLIERETISKNLRGIIRFALISIFLLSSLVACASTPKLPDPPPKYVYQEERVSKSSSNSLWIERASLYEDTRARRLNDLVTIKVVENIAGSGKADTVLNRKSETDAAVDNVFGIPKNLNLGNLFGKGNTFSPLVKGAAESDFEGSGTTNREGRLIGTITAKVVEVLPNGNLVIESRKEITINNEKQILALKGIIRTEDIAVDNTVLSNKIADAEIFFIGDGVISEKQSPGWLARFIDRIWPF
ncbi:MAG: flagellar basal body L-ring protein FlgH [Thermodesulfovibrionales bacterium]|nr:flagellar basal body L-ring protein FlgH [Thermodesulfovibrionales bacterium]